MSGTRGRATTDVRDAVPPRGNGGFQAASRALYCACFLMKKKTTEKYFGHREQPHRLHVAGEKKADGGGAQNTRAKRLFGLLRETVATGGPRIRDGLLLRHDERAIRRSASFFGTPHQRAHAPARLADGGFRSDHAAA